MPSIDHIAATVVQGDLPTQHFDAAMNSQLMACDIETSGLNWRTDEIGSVQVFVPGESIAIVRPNGTKPARLLRIFESEKVRKIFHHAVFDLRFIIQRWNCDVANVQCTKIASKLLRHESEHQTLAFLVWKFLNIKIDKDQQQSDWLQRTLTESQIRYAATDVAFLPDLMQSLFEQMSRTGLHEFATRCFEHIPTRARLDIGDFGDIYEY